ncbi:MFS transporter [Bacillus gobiensis]|uniref:MFS transporter n=1 Tax=Bacillus gobiensis TaxID=1441095 RepID=UPI003D21ABDA
MNKTIALFFFIMFVIGTDTFLISPLLPILSSLYDVTTDVSGWMVSSYALGYALIALIAGPISDNLNRKTVMIYGLAAFALSTFLCGLASDFWSMCAYRFIAGVSAAFVTPQVWASIPLVVKPDQIVKSMGIATAGLAVSQALGLPMGSFLASLSWRAPFFVLGAFSIVLIFLTVFMPAIKSSQQIKQQSIFNRYKLLFSESHVFIVFFAYLLFQTGNFAAFTFLGTWLNDDYHFNVAQIGTAMLVLGMGNFIGSFFGSRYISKIGQTKSLLGGILLMGLLYFCLPFFPSVILVEISFFLLFFFAGILFPIMMSLFQSLNPSARGTIASLSNSVMYFGTTLGAFIAGQLYAHFGNFNSVTSFTAAMFLLSIITYKASGILGAEQKVNKPAS